MVKRFRRDDAQRLSADEAEEQAMVEAVIAVRRALAGARGSERCCHGGGSHGALSVAPAWAKDGD